jgi:hypothetical protein
VGVVAIGGDDLVALTVRGEESNRGRFLPNVDVEVAAELALTEAALTRFLEEANEHHLTIKVNQFFGCHSRKFYVSRHRWGGTVGSGRSPLFPLTLRRRHPLASELA